MYELLLAAHSWLRWLVLLAGAWALFRSWRGWRSRRPWQVEDDRASLVFMAGCDLQLLIGFSLYFVFSPSGFPGLDRLGAAMADPAGRFWAVEHPVAMAVAAVAAHLARTRRVSDSGLRHRRAALACLVALLAIVAATPWPFTPASRPLWRPW